MTKKEKMKFKEYHKCVNCKKLTKSLHGFGNELCWNCYCRSNDKYKRIDMGMSRTITNKEDALNKIYAMKTYKNTKNNKICVCSFPRSLEGIKFKIQVVNGD